ncbi:hypothetical protein HN446_00775 [bacterium]|jgi:hypothetical protein|nr:hypothetical protein [bacterium]
MKNLVIWIVYDSITSSIFPGQILRPLLQKKNIDTDVVIISFEPKKLSKISIEKLIPKTSGVKYIELKRPPFIGRPALFYSIQQLKKELKHFENYKIIARCSFASWISKKSVSSKCIALTLQARAIIAEEYAYTHDKSWNIIKKILHKFKENACRSIEKTAYLPHKTIPTKVEAVSQALSEYLTSVYKVPKSTIYIAKDDIPTVITEKQKQLWRKAIRKKLHISDDVTLYCYNGSAKPWQCPDKTIVFFNTQYKKNKNTRFLIITNDTDIFIEKLKKTPLPKKTTCIMSIKHRNIYKYLAACDYGIIFREKHIVNWTSRPTKILEYKAARVPIIHNNTVKIITSTKTPCCETIEVT